MVLITHFASSPLLCTAFKTFKYYMLLCPGVGGGSKPESSKKKQQCTSTSITSSTQKEDPRPPDDYNEPWDHKAPRPIPPSTRQGRSY